MRDQKQKLNPLAIAVAVAGAVVGAGIAVAGAALSEKKTRKKVKKSIAYNKEKLEKIVSSAKNSVGKTTKEVNNAIKSL